MGALAHGKKVQFRRNTSGDKAWFDLSDHRKNKPQAQKKVRNAKEGRITLDIAPPDMSFLARLAAYRTQMARLSGRESELPAEGKWTRKTLTESLLAAACDSQRAQLREMIEACGDIPSATDAGELNRYVARVFAWSEKSSRK